MNAGGILFITRDTAYYNTQKQEYENDINPGNALASRSNGC